MGGVNTRGRGLFGICVQAAELAIYSGMAPTSQEQHDGLRAQEHEGLQKSGSS